MKAAVAAAEKQAEARRAEILEEGAKKAKALASSGKKRMEAAADELLTAFLSKY